MKQFREVSTGAVLDESGKKLIEYPAWAAPVISNGFMYIRGKGRLICLDLLAIQ